MISNIDTLVISYDFKDYDRIIQPNIGMLEEAKKRKSDNNMHGIEYKEYATFLGMNFEVLGNGLKGYSYILHSEELEIRLSRCRSGGLMNYPLVVRFKAELLWSSGLNCYHWFMDKVYKYLGQPIAERISRVDMACHIDKIHLMISDLDRFVGRYRKDAVFRNDRKVQTMYIGSRKTQKIMLRIYNKSKMIMEERQKEWFFNIWNNHNMAIDNVWNVEFEMHRPFLKELKLSDEQVGISTFQELTDNLTQMWMYLTHRWVRHVDTDSATRIERCTESSMWRIIQQGFKEYDLNGYIERSVILEKNQDSLLPGLAGYFTSYCAKANIKNIEDAMKVLTTRIPMYLRESKGVDFEEIVNNKWLRSKEFYGMLGEQVIKTREGIDYPSKSERLLQRKNGIWEQAEFNFSEL